MGVSRSHTDQRGEADHSQDGSESVSGEIKNRVGCGQGESWEHAEQMGPASESVQGSDRQGGVAMPVGTDRDRVVSILGSVHVHVDVSVPVVLVNVGMDASRSGPPQAPEADADQDQPNQSLGPAGQRFGLERGDVTQGDRNDGDDAGAAGVTQSPTQSSAPSRASVLDSERGDGRQMIRAGDNMVKSRNEAGDWGEHGREGCEPQVQPRDGRGLASTDFTGKPWEWAHLRVLGRRRCTEQPRCAGGREGGLGIGMPSYERSSELGPLRELVDPASHVCRADAIRSGEAETLAAECGNHGSMDHGLSQIGLDGALGG